MMPVRIAHLDRDARGFPIPWNVLRGDDGTPFFTVSDDRKMARALREELCPICGGPLGRWRWFVGGPRSAFDANGWYTDLPNHHDCARFALATCPYLAAPNFHSHLPNIPHAEKLPEEAMALLDPTVIPERPALFVAIAGTRIEVLDRGPLPPYVRPRPPILDYEFWRHGTPLSDSDALPMLRAVFGPEWTPPPRADWPLRRGARA